LKPLYLGNAFSREIPFNSIEVAMKLPKLFLVFPLILTVAGCGKPVPKEKLAYVGEWQEKTMYLLITQDGSVKYKRLKNGASTSIDGPLKAFDGDNFDVGVGPMATTFVVSKAPYQDGDKWKMVVDGRELIKTSD
jgi:hypothetical protein